MNNPDHIHKIKEYFNEKTETKAIAKLIKWFAIDRKDESERLQESMRKYIKKANELEKLKELLKDIAIKESQIKKIIEND